MSPANDVKSYRDLAVWQLGLQIVDVVYGLSTAFSSDERFGLTSQLRRAAASIPADIAEGHARSSTKDFVRHLSITVGSLAEVTTFLELAERLAYVEHERTCKLFGLCQEERRMLRGLQASLRRRIK